MNAERLTAYRLELPLIAPLRSAHGTEAVRDLILVRCRLDRSETEGDPVEGWGECPTLRAEGYSPETTEVAWRSLVDGIPLASAAAGAIADARADAAARSGGDASGRPQMVVRTCRVVSIDDDWPPHGDLKLKIDTGVSLRRLAALRRAGPDRRIAVDANGTLRHVNDAAAVIEALGELMYFEQPFARDRFDLHASLRRATGVRVALDESVTSAADLRLAHAAGALDVVSVKPARLGGVVAAGAVADLAESLGVEWFVGGMWESGIGRAAALSLAARQSPALPTDLGPTDRYLARDVCAPLQTRGDGLVVPGGPGWGRVPDPAALDELTVAVAELVDR